MADEEARDRLRAEMALQDCGFSQSQAEAVVALVEGATQASSEAVSGMLGGRPSLMHQAGELLEHFTYAHLPPELQEISRPFGELAGMLVRTDPETETIHALRKLLEAKDCAVRAHLQRKRREVVE